MIAIVCEHVQSAYGFLLRLPLWGRKNVSLLSVDSLWACVPVGFLIGTIIAVSGAILQNFGFSLRFVAWSMIGVGVIITGALHEDALADMLDGFFGGKDAQSRLTIMKDSRLGVFALLGLLVVKSAEAELLVQILASEKGLVFIAAMGGISRGFWGLSLRLSPVLRSGKFNLASELGVIKDRQIMISLLLVAILAVLSLPFILSLVLLAFLICTCFIWSFYCRYKIGGINGDCLGSLQQINILLGFIIYVVGVL